MKKLLILILGVLIFASGCQSNHKIKTMNTSQSPLFKFQQIELRYNQYNTLAIDDKGKIFVCVSPKNNKNINTLIEYEQKNSAIKTIYTSRHSDAIMQNTMVNNNYVMWVDSRADGMDSSIMLLNRKTRQIKEIGKTNTDYMTAVAPILYKNYIGWMNFINPNKSTIRLYNIKEGSIKDVATVHNYNLYNNFIDINDGKILWTDSFNDKGSYNLYDLSNGDTISFNAKFKYPGYAKLSNGRIYSINFKDTTQWLEQEFGVFDIKKNTYQRIETNSPYINYFDVTRKAIAIINDKQELKLYNPLTYKIIKNNQVTDKLSDFIRSDDDKQFILNYQGDFNESKIGLIK